MVTITISAWPEALKLRTAAVHAAIRAGLVEGAMRCVAIAVKATDDKSVMNIGQYKRSWRSVPTDRGATIENIAPYSGVIEDGRRPNGPPPPIDAIVAWCARKGIYAKPQVSLGSIAGEASGGVKTDEQKAASRVRGEGQSKHAEKILGEVGASVRRHADPIRRAAESIRWSIAKKGTPAMHVLADVMPEMIVMVSETARKRVLAAAQGKVA
ncbi:MAG: hypothetical protein WC700_09020 [Gemmatimonadaceae bacterium]|jgi:hypothetical protein